MNKSKMRYVGIVLALCLLSSLCTYIAVRATSPTGTFTLTGGIYPGASSFTVWKEGSNYFSKNGSGYVSYSGSNASEIISDSLSNTGNVFVMAGEYSLDSPIVVSSNFVLEGEGLQTHFSAIAGNTGSMIINDGYVDVDPFGTATNYGVIRNLYFDGNSIADRGIQAKINYLDIQNCYFSDLNGYAIKMVRSSVITISQNKVLSTGGDGIDVLYCGQAQISDNYVAGVTDDGIGIVHSWNIVVSDNYVDHVGAAAGSCLSNWGGHDNTFIGNTGVNGFNHGIAVMDYEGEYPYNINIAHNDLYSNNHNGINIVGTTGTDSIRNLVITGNLIHGNQERGIYVLQSGFGTIKGNILYDNSQKTDNGYDAILIDTTATGNCTKWIISENLINSTTTTQHRYGIYLPTTALCYCIVTNNISQNSAGGDEIVVNDSTSKNFENYEGTSWVS